MEIFFCSNCMKQLQADIAVCPHCKKSTKKGNKAHQLPINSVIGGRYIVGRVTDEAERNINYIGFDLIDSKRVSIKELYIKGKNKRSNSTEVKLINESYSKFFPADKQRFVDFANHLKASSQENTILGIFEDNATVYIVSSYSEQEANADDIKTVSSIAAESKSTAAKTHRPFPKKAIAIAASAALIIGGAVFAFSKASENGSKGLSIGSSAPAVADPSYKAASNEGEYVTEKKILVKKQTAVYREDGTTSTTEYEYDKYGNTISLIYNYQSGEYKSKIERQYEYTDDGFTLKETAISSNSYSDAVTTVVTEYDYESKDMLGNYVRYVIEDGAKLYKQVSTEYSNGWTIYAYSPDGLFMECTVSELDGDRRVNRTYDKDGKLTKRIEYTYNENDRVLLTCSYDGDGEALYKQEWDWTEDNHRKSMVYTSYEHDWIQDYSYEEVEMDVLVWKPAEPNPNKLSFTEPEKMVLSDDAFPVSVYSGMERIEGFTKQTLYNDDVYAYATDCYVGNGMLCLVVEIQNTLDTRLTSFAIDLIVNDMDYGMSLGRGITGSESLSIEPKETKTVDFWISTDLLYYAGLRDTSVLKYEAAPYVSGSDFENLKGELKLPSKLTLGNVKTASAVVYEGVLDDADVTIECLGAKLIEGYHGGYAFFKLNAESKESYWSLFLNINNVGKHIIADGEKYKMNRTDSDFIFLSNYIKNENVCYFCIPFSFGYVDATDEMNVLHTRKDYPKTVQFDINITYSDYSTDERVEKKLDIDTLHFNFDENGFGTISN